MSPHLYDPFFTPTERKRLDETPWDDLSHEIDLIRIFFRRILEAEKMSPQPIPVHLRMYALQVICRAILTLGHLVRLHFASTNSHDAIWQVWLQAIREANRIQGVVP